MLTLALLLAADVVAAPPPPPPPPETPLEKLVQERTLKNGMTWLLVRRPAAPVFSAYWRVRAGGDDERPGITGLAHLFEHMAFKGTAAVGTKDWAAEKPILEKVAAAGDALAEERRLGARGDADKLERLSKELAAAQQAESKLIEKDEWDEIYSKNGAVGMNATTDKDLTSYFVSFPKNRLELWARMEASRFAAPVLREFFSERDVVTQERRMRTETSPGGMLYEQLNAVAFGMGPQAWPVVGTNVDLATLRLSDALAFYEKYYVPSNAVGSIVGDIDVDATVALLEQTFGQVPARARPLPPSAQPWDQTQAGERIVKVEFDAAPQVIVAWHKPTLPARDDYVFDAIETILGEGTTSRLHRSLVIEKRLAAGVGAFGGPCDRLDNLFMISATPVAPHTAAELVSAIDSEIARLQDKPVTERELRRVLNHLEASLARRIATNEGLADTLSFYQAVADDWRYVARHEAVLATVTPEDVQRVARTYFVSRNRTVAELVRPQFGPSQTAPSGTKGGVK